MLTLYGAPLEKVRSRQLALAALLHREADRMARIRVLSQSDLHQW
jgi:hypothetical protein